MVERYTLKNGIPLFVVESHSSPVVSIQAWVSRGSAYESEKVAGISHFLEHALFKGTKRRKVGQIALEIESRGGEINAFTSFEETAYYTTLASRYFEDGLDVIADAIQNPLFDEEEMNREREVIIEEIKRAQDSPYKMVSANLWKASFPGTPYGRPVLGFEETVRKITGKVLREYFQKHYHAGTFSIFIVGDVEKKKALAIAQRKFAKLKKKKAEGLPKNMKLAKSGGARLIPIARDIKECHLQLGYLAPGITDPLVPALDLACSAVGQGESSRLYQRLVKEKRIALEAHMGLVATSHFGLSVLGLMTAPENLNGAVEEGVRCLQEAVGDLKEGEVERVKSSLEAEVVGGKETVEGYARRLGYYYVQFGDPDYEKKYLDAVLSIDTETAKRALGKVLKERSVLSLAHPLDFVPDKKALSDPLTRHPKTVTVPVSAPGTPERVERNGIPFITKRVDSLPMVAVRFLFLGGSREETPQRLGIAHLFQRLWTAGTPSYSSLQIAQTLEALGASIHGFAGKNTLGLSVEFLSKQWPVVKPLLKEVLLNPTFPEEEFATEKELCLREIHSERDTPGQICHLNFLSAIYGKHPYGRSSLGTKESVGALNTADLNDFYRSYIHQKNLVVSTVGNFSSESWITELHALVAQLPADGKRPAPPFPISENAGIRTVIERKSPLFQTHVLAGFLGASFQNEERYALKLLSSCLAGQGGRLFLELRDKQSLAYQVSPMNNDSPERGIFAFYIGCSPEKLEKALSGIRIEIEKILNDPMDARELARAKEYWIGRFELEMQRYSAQAMLYGLDEIYRLGYDHSLKVPEIIKGVSAQDIQDAARKFLTLDRATLSIVHNTELNKEQVQEAWQS